MQARSALVSGWFWTDHNRYVFNQLDQIGIEPSSDPNFSEPIIEVIRIIGHRHQEYCFRNIMSHLSTRISPHPAVTPKLSIGHREKERTSVQSDQSHPCLDLADPHPRRALPSRSSWRSLLRHIKHSQARQLSYTAWIPHNSLVSALRSYLLRAVSFHCQHGSRRFV